MSSIIYTWPCLQIRLILREMAQLVFVTPITEKGKNPQDIISNIRNNLVTIYVPVLLTKVLQDYSFYIYRLREAACSSFLKKELTALLNKGSLKTAFLSRKIIFSHKTFSLNSEPLFFIRQFIDKLSNNCIFI